MKKGRRAVPKDMLSRNPLLIELSSSVEGSAGIQTTKFISRTNFLYLFPRAIVTWPLILVVDFDLQVINQSERNIGSCYINDASQ